MLTAVDRSTLLIDRGEQRGEHTCEHVLSPAVAPASAASYACVRLCMLSLSAPRRVRTVSAVRRMVCVLESKTGS